MTASTPSTALTVIEPKDVVITLENFPEAEFNRVIPTQTIRMPSDLLAPVVQVVQLDPATGQNALSADHYKSNDVPEGHRALTARGLNKVATAAAVSFFDERRVDDGSDPDVIGVTVTASMILPTGQRITAPGTKWVNIKAQNMTDRQRAKYRSFFYEHVSTRARNRAIRALLSLKASYPDREIAKPFAVVSFAPNMNHPAVQERYLDSVAPRSAQLYGPGPEAAPVLGSGEPVTELREIAQDDDDQATDGAPAAKGDDDLPAFLRSEGATAVAAPLELLALIRDTAESGNKTGGAKPPQIESLQGIFGPLGGRATTAGLKSLWPDLDINALTSNQAEAIIGTARSFENPEAFQAAWRSMAGLE